MPRRPATVTQADVARTIRAAQKAGAERVEVRPDGTMSIVSEGQWLVWEDGHWRKDENGAVMRLAKATIEKMFEESSLINDEDVRASVRSFALLSQGARYLNAMIKLAESEAEVVLAVKKIDADPYLLGVQNGVIDLRTREFRQARRDDYITKRAGIAFDPKAECPEWEKFLRKIFPNKRKPSNADDLFNKDSDDETIGYVRRAVGYCLTGLTVEEVLFVLWGTGANGKSTFREILFALLGDYAVGADASLLMTRKSGGATPDLARLHGRRLVTVNETEQNDVLNENRVKFITGHDTITARDLYERFFDFPPTHKTAVTTNHKPIVRGTDEGIWRRIHLLLFGIIIAKAERDPNFREKVLMPELAGILNWALAGVKEYLAGGLKPPETVTKATGDYRKDMDLVAQWVEERCIEGPGAWTDTAALHEETCATPPRVRWRWPLRRRVR